MISRFDRQFFIIGDKKPPPGRRPVDNRKFIVSRYRRLPLGSLSASLSQWSTTASRTLVYLATLVAFLLTIAIYAGGPIAGALIAAGGGAENIIVGALLGLIGPSVGHFLYSRRWWLQPAIGYLARDRLQNGFPGDSTLFYDIEEKDAVVAVSALEGAGFWNVRACRLEPPNGRRNVRISAMLNLAQHPNPMQHAVDVLNAAAIPFWPAGSSRT